VAQKSNAEAAKAATLQYLRSLIDARSDLLDGRTCAWYRQTNGRMARV